MQAGGVVRRATLSAILRVTRSKAKKRAWLKLRVASGSGEPEGNGAEATRSRFLYRQRV